MKRITFAMISALLFVACQKEEAAPTPNPGPDPTPTVSLSGTSWVGCFDDIYTYHGQEYPATLTWNFNFLTDSTGELLLELVIAGTEQPSMSSSFRYTFDGTEGWIYDEVFSEPYSFDYDSTTNTLTMELYISDGTTSLGGTTVFHSRGQMPTADFPANTVWNTEQYLTVSDTLMSVQWRFEFWDYSLGAALSYSANGTCWSTSALWLYDSNSHSGSILINSSTYPFTYDPSTGILSLEYSTTLYDTSVPIGGTLQFIEKKIIR